ncbi:hypothetical protein [Cellvibrio sp. QJXJ]|uniref:hypothetical protein n=1 Tax=Cellvibrio sp. QJXJ TaxID=2964606 RepID=UPI0021C3BAC0|nr:hypothetical protein [Cellvibrio sp. QJXJ]UUA71246.1 hypothetical protein NNX04_12575 [Cellvibrio sp. QJXJ]
MFIDVYDANGSLGQDGIRNEGNGIYNGILCRTGAAPNVCTRNTVSVRQDIVLVMSTGIADTNIDGLLVGQPGNIAVALGETQLISITLRDSKGNSMPAGTTVTIDDADVDNATVSINPDPVEIATNRTTPTTFTVSIKGDSALAASGSFKVVVEVPTKSGVIGSTRSYTTTIN